MCEVGDHLRASQSSNRSQNPFLRGVERTMTRVGGLPPPLFPCCGGCTAGSAVGRGCGIGRGVTARAGGLRKKVTAVAADVLCGGDPLVQSGSQTAVVVRLLILQIAAALIDLVLQVAQLCQQGIQSGLHAA